MVIKRLLVLLTLVAVVAGIVSACGASASTEPAPKSTSASCIQDRYGRSCQNHPIVETPNFVFSPDGRNAYLLSWVLPEFPEEERSAIWIYDRDPATGSLVQKPGIAGCISEGNVKGCQQGKAFRNGVESIRVSPDGRNLYAATYKGLAVFDRNLSSGTLTQKAGAEGCITSTRKLIPTCAPARGLPGAGDVAVSPDGKNVYATTPRALVVLDRDPSTGVLAQKPGPEGMVPEGAGEDVLVSPDGLNVYVNARSLITFDRDSETGALTPVPGPAGCVSEKGEGGCRRGHEFSVYDIAISLDGHNVYGSGEVTQKVGVVVILDRRPDGTLVQKRGRAGCFGGEGRKSCIDPDGTGLGEVRGITVSPDGKRVYIFEYPFPGEGGPLLRHPSGRLTEVPRD